ncbi:MAG TPA: cation:proton antiporter [Rugosimonospora sp.]|nr:cation:proton antiporter [Rugosimonospora sp.]
MTGVWAQAALWLALALVAAAASVYLRLASALSEIVVGMLAGLVVATVGHGTDVLGGGSAWVTFLASAGSVVLTFLAGAELDPDTFRATWKQATGVGLVGFAAPFLGCAFLAIDVLGWSTRAGWLAGVSMSTTSVAVVYAVMLESGLNRTSFGKTVLAACFVNDLATVLALGLIFSPFTWRTVTFAVVTLLAVLVLPRVVRVVFAHIGARPSEAEAKFLLAALFGLAALATWAGSEAVLPAYLAGMVLAGGVGHDDVLVRRLRTLTFGLLTPFYFIRAGTLVSLPAVVAAPLAFLTLLGTKVLLKVVGVYPVTRGFRSPRRESAYTTMLMSTGLTFGTISALYGLNNGIVTTAQYSVLVAAVIGSAVVPTVIANAFFLPRHLLPLAADEEEDTPEVTADGLG